MKLTEGLPFWLVNNGLPFSYKKLTKNIHTEVAIIGGGITGALCAYYLTAAGVPCVLVDGRTVGLGSTCASTSLLQYELDTPLHQLIKQVGRERAETAYKLCAEAINKISAIAEVLKYDELEKRNSLFFSTHNRQKKFMQKEYDERKRNGFQVQLLNKDEIKEQYGFSAAHAILSQEGATLNAYSFAHTIYQYCIRKGLQVYDRTNIKDIQYNTRNVTLTTQEDCVITANKVINASGFEVVNFISKDVIDFYCTYAIISEHQNEKDELWKDRIMMWNTDNPYLYMRLTKDNRIIVGGRDEKYKPGVFNQKILDRKAALLQKDFCHLFPQINFKQEFAWCGTFGSTKDSLPYIGTYNKTPNTYYALGFGGNGITFSVIAAEIITELIKGVKSKNAWAFSFDR